MNGWKAASSPEGGLGGAPGDDGGSTGNHRFWSVDSHAIIRVDTLNPGERVQSLNGIAGVNRVDQCKDRQPFFNIEVQGSDG